VNGNGTSTALIRLSCNPHQSICACQSWCDGDVICESLRKTDILGEPKIVLVAGAMCEISGKNNSNGPFVVAANRNCQVIDRGRGRGKKLQAPLDQSRASAMERSRT
jgi:hypothetical protein